MGLESEEPATTPGPYLIEAIARACDVLRTFGGDAETLRLCDIAARAELNKATVYRILFTLERGGLVERTPERAYRLTFRTPRQGRYRLGYVAPAPATPFLKSVYDSIQRAAFEEKIDLLTTSHKKGGSQALQIAELFRREKVDLVIAAGIDQHAGTLLAKKLQTAGIPVIGVETTLEDATCYGADNYRAGFLGGRHLVQWALQYWQGGVDTVLLLNGATPGAAMNARLNGIASAIRQGLPALNESQFLILNGNGRLDASQSAVRKYLKTSSSQHALIGAVDDLSAIGAARAFEEIGRGKCCAAVGQGASTDACSEMRSPGSRLIGSVAYFPENYGEAVISIATNILRQRTVPQALYTKHKLITPENVDNIYPAHNHQSLNRDYGVQMLRDRI